MSEPHCRDLLVRLHAFLDGELEASSCVEIRAHLDDCRSCLSNADFERAFKQLVARSCRESAPPGLLDRMKQILD